MNPASWLRARQGPRQPWAQRAARGLARERREDAWGTPRDEQGSGERGLPGALTLAPRATALPALLTPKGLQPGAESDTLALHGHPPLRDADRSRVEAGRPHPRDAGRRRAGRRAPGAGRAAAPASGPSRPPHRGRHDQAGSEPAAAGARRARRRRALRRPRALLLPARNGAPRAVALRRGRGRRAARAGGAPGRSGGARPPVAFSRPPG